VDRSCRFFRQKKEEKEGKMQVETHLAPGPSFSFLFFLPANPLAQSFGGPVPFERRTAGMNELN